MYISMTVYMYYDFMLFNGVEQGKNRFLIVVLWKI